MTYYEICNNPKPTIKELEHLLKNDPRVHQKKAYKKALELKLQAIKQEPSPIEKTMTEEQLYNANSPFWVHDYSVKELEVYFNIVEHHPTYNDVITIIKTLHPSSNNHK